MPVKSAITWTETTWSPVIGCSKVSEGCRHCYAKREVDTRWSKNPKSVWFGRDFGDVLCRPDQLDAPLHWKKPRRIFVCPRADLFHEDVGTIFIAQVFAFMGIASQHTFQVLTKRAERMRALLNNPVFHAEMHRERLRIICGSFVADAWEPDGRESRHLPLSNVWLGVSVENQAAADERIPLLLQTPAAVRWISAEPLLGPMDLSPAYFPCHNAEGMRPDPETGASECCRECDYTGISNEMGLDWVVVGGESGPHARPMHPQWARSLRDQCAAAGVAYLFKQWGEWKRAVDFRPDVMLPANRWADVEQSGVVHLWPDARQLDGTITMGRGGKHLLQIYDARLLDGVLHDGYPEVRHGR